jgi:chromosome segregation ATPase
MDHIRDAFDKVKQDISSLKQELEFLRNALVETRNEMIDICAILQNLLKKTENIEKQQKELENNSSTQNLEKQTVSTHPSTHPSPFKPLKPQILPISTGNGGVPTDRQTDRQTHRQTQNTQEIQKNPVDNAVEILDSLSTIKKEIRLKFRRLTEQEMLIFSTIYQLEEENGHTDYKTVSEKLKLTESSIRDYVGRLIKKGIPVEKTKINNKSIQLKISGNLKKITNLPTIMKLRDL